MSLGDRVDDREAKARTTLRPRRIDPSEALEGMGKEFGREAGAGIADVELDPVARGTGPEADLAVSVT